MIQAAKRTVLTMQEAADELGISRQRLHVLCSTGGIAVDKVNPRLSLIRRCELEKLKQKRNSEKRA